MRNAALGAAVLVGLSLAGEAALRPFGVASGGPLVGFVVLSLLLRTRIVPLEAIEDASGFAVRHLAYPIVAVTAGAVFETEALGNAGVAFAAAISAGTLAVLVFVAFAARLLRSTDDSTS